VRPIPDRTPVLPAPAGNIISRISSNRGKPLCVDSLEAGPCILALCFVVGILSLQGAHAQAKKPNILVIMGDDIGWYNASIYNRCDIGYETPNIDRIGKEGRSLPELVWTAKLYCRPRRILHRSVTHPDWAHQGRSPRRHGRPPAAGPDRSRGPQGSGLRHRAIRQEPSRRP
jgi:hypothetical protein